MGTKTKQGYFGTPPIVTNGLILHLDAGNRRSYPSSGTTWNDLSGNGNSGSLINGPIFNNNNQGSITFDGTNDYVSTQSINILYITIGAWVRANANTFGFIVNKSRSILENIVTYSLNIGGNNSSPEIDGMAFYNGSWRNSGINTNIRGDGKWHYVVGTFDGTTLGYYIDGKLDAFSTEGSGFTLPSNSQLTDIGRYSNDNQYFGGDIALVQIYNRALSVKEINQNYNSIKTRFGLT